MSNNTSVTQQEHFYVKKVDFQAIAELISVALLIIVVNFFVLVLFAKRRRLRKPPNYVLFSLAICDFVNGAMNIPLFIIVGFTPVVKSPELRLYLHVLVGVVNNVTAISTCYHILFATTEKYLSIIWPLKHRRMSRKTVLTVLAIIWVVSGIVGFFPFVWVNVEDRHTRTNLQLGHVIFCLVAVFLVPYSFMVYEFVVIFKWISTQGKTKTKRLSEADTSRQAVLEKRCLLLFVSMATIYLVCWLPWFILMLLYKVLTDWSRLRIPAHAFVLVRYATSIINPILYTFIRRDFKKALKSVICQRWNYCGNWFAKARKSSEQGARLTDGVAEDNV